MKKRVLITGGTGLVGAALTKALVARGYHVVITSQNPHGKQKESDGTTVVSWNSRDIETLVPYLQGAYGVVHLAGAPIYQKWDEKGKDAILRSRIESGSALAAAIRKVTLKPKILIHGSSIGYYGNTGNETATETRKPGKTWLAYVCAHGEASTESVERLHVRRCVIRTAPALARGGYLKKRARAFYWFLGGPVGTGEERVSWISIEDEVNAIIFLLENTKARGDYNLVSPHAVSETHFARALGDAMRRPSWLSTQIWLLNFRFGREKTEELILASSKVEPTRLLKEGFRFADVDIETVLERIYRD